MIRLRNLWDAFTCIMLVEGEVGEEIGGDEGEEGGIRRKKEEEEEE